MKPISSDAFVRALMRAGFAVYRHTPDATILERGVRAVTVRAREELGCEAVMDLRRMAGLSWEELDGALDATELRRSGAPQRRPPASTVSPMPHERGVNGDSP